MRIINPATLTEYWREHPDAEDALKRWLAEAKKASWRSIQDVRKTYPHADAITVTSGSIVTAFNIKGNAYRLIVAIHYNRQRIYILGFMTHAKYDKDRWKGQL